MEKIKAKLLSQTGNICIFEIHDAVKLDGEYEISKVKKKRSLDANAYMWALLNKQATALNLQCAKTSNWDCYIHALKSYGQYTYTVVKPNALQKFKETWRECVEVGEIDINGQKAIQLQCFFGSSCYDTKEFTALLNGIIEDCKDLGIETATPDEVAHMIELRRIHEEKNKGIANNSASQAKSN